MADVVRGCLASGLQYVVDHEEGKFTGPLADAVDEFSDYLTHGGNFTINIRSKGDGVGELNSSTGLYDGCIGRLHRNEPDVLLQLSDYPLNATNVTQDYVAFETSLQFATTYIPRKTSDVNLVPIESCFASFDRNVWSLCLAMVVVMYLLIIIRCKMSSSMRRKFFILKQRASLQCSRRVSAVNSMQRTYARYARIGIAERRASLPLLARTNVSLWRRQPTDTSIQPRGRKEKIQHDYYLMQVLAHMARFGSLHKTNGLFRKTLFICCSIFSLLVVHYFCSYIKTELVTVTPPEYYKSYQDLLDNKVALVFGRGFSHYKKFKFASDGSKAKALWDFSVSKYSEKSINIATQDIDGVMSAIGKVVYKRKMAYIADLIILGIIMRDACCTTLDPLMRQRLATLTGIEMDNDAYDVSPVVIQDENESPSLKSLLFSEFFAGHLYKQLTRKFQRMYEQGIVTRTLSKASNKRFSEAFVGEVKAYPGYSNDLDQCRRGVIKEPEVHLNAVTFGNTKNVLGWFLVSMVVALVISVIESAMGA